MLKRQWIHTPSPNVGPEVPNAVTKVTMWSFPLEGKEDSNGDPPRKGGLEWIRDLLTYCPVYFGHSWGFSASEACVCHSRLFGQHPAVL